MKYLEEFKALGEFEICDTRLDAENIELDFYVPGDLIYFIKQKKTYLVCEREVFKWD